MSGVKKALVLVVVAGLAGAAACADEPPDVVYARRIAAERARKDEFFASGSSDSPIKPGDQAKFLPISYFDIDPAYAAPATLRLLDERTRLVMPTSTGKLRDMERVGFLEFTLKGQPQKLTAFSEAGQPVSRLFVPFSDLTSGTETYQAGRYMDIDPQTSGVYVVDFNSAYHPYCYYNSDYDCPFPPAENRLKVPIRAGERLRAADALAPGR
ncbi:MAG: DUF1684 domain-containing protein [Vicinamibacterales bacterium]